MGLINHNTSFPNDGLGDTLRAAFDHQNSMNAELYDTVVFEQTGKDLSTNDFTDAERDKLSGIAEGAEVNVQADWAQNDNTQDDFIKNKPTLNNYVNTIGYFDYSNSNTTPLTLVSNVEKKLTNDCVGTNTDISHPTYGVTRLFNPTTNNIVLNELGVGDLVKLRVDVSITTTTANQVYKCNLRLGIGTSKEFEVTIHDEQIKSTGSHKRTFYTGFYVGSEEVRTALGELILISDNSGSVVVNGFFFEAIKRNVNFVDIGGAPQGLQQVLETGATATFTHPTTNETLEIKEVDDITIGYRTGKSFTQSDGNLNTSEFIALGYKAVTNGVANGDVQSVNTSIEYGLSTTESEYTQIRATQISDSSTSEQGNTTYEIPTPKLNVDAILRDPILETSGTYTRATEEWVMANVSGGGIPDAPNDSNAYVRSGLSWVIGYTKSAIDTLLGNKVDKLTGYSLTKNDLTDALKTTYDNAESWISTNGANVLSHLSNTSNPHNVTKSQVGLSNVDNTSDVNKPVSTVQATAIGLKEDSSNKSTSTSDSASTTKFPVWSVILSYFDASRLRTILGISTLSGSNTGDNSANTLYSGLATSKQDVLTDVNFGTFSNGLTAKTTPVDADTLNISDSADSNKSKKLSWANIKATLKTYFDSLYVSRTTWVDYSATSTIVGWSSFTQKFISYKITDDTIDCFFYLEGTSNSTSVTFTLPNNSAQGFTVFSPSGYNVNNGAVLTNSARIAVSTGTNIITISRDFTGLTYTASGTKSVAGRITFKI